MLLGARARGDATVVYGTRTFGSHNSYSYLYVLGNRAVTTVANVLFNCYISDLETCFKLMPLELYRSLDVESAGFGMEAEITGKLLRPRDPAVRGADLLQRPHPRGGQETHLARRRRGHRHPYPSAPGRPQGMARWLQRSRRSRARPK